MLTVSGGSSSMSGLSGLVATWPTRRSSRREMNEAEFLARVVVGPLSSAFRLCAPPQVFIPGYAVIGLS
jgi:hypothetical protein